MVGVQLLLNLVLLFLAGVLFQRGRSLGPRLKLILSKLKSSRGGRPPDNLCSKIKVGQALEQHCLRFAFAVLHERNRRDLKNPNLEEMNAPKAILMNAWPYLEDKMNLPVPELESAIPFYISILGFELAGKSTDPHPRAELIRDHIRIGLAENGGDPSQEGCFIEVDNAGEAFEEFKFNGLQKEISGMDIEKHGDRSWKTFYVVAPDGLCFCFGERV